MPETLTGNPAQGLGFFGKLPSHGDFLSRRLPRSFTDPWDRWLQSVIANSREQLAGDWLDIYLTCPLWRFVTSPGLCGSTAWAGVLMPSVDRVGRYFPLTLATPLREKTNLLGLVCDANEWFQACEDLALSSLDDDFDIDSFDQSMRNIAGPAQDMAPTELEQHRTGRPAWHFDIHSLDSTGQTLRSVSEVLLKKLLPAHSLWWTHGSERIQPSLLISEGLPPVECFSALLDGEWKRWGWGGYRLPLAETEWSATKENEKQVSPTAD